MNYLAHIFLSGADKKVQLGNFFADAVKGSSYKNYPPAITNGILLHRAIDDFTDNHPAVKAMIQQMRPHFGRYSAVLLDIYFDYLLASRFDTFSDIPLKRFARSFYFTLIRHRRWLPDRFKRFMWHFILTNRLYKYASREGIKEALEIMVRVHRITVSPSEAIEYLQEHEMELWDVFHPFFTELQEFVSRFATTDKSN
ncbi:acyl carrier protein phosphodiesterase [Parabacteroides sp. PFB2-10]|uniref:acyl carrier protein phosphodiesterase n=1 Tax=Parabacteroides sp. PFB2-10 TaxID=1742405 RepID=UPI002475E1DB|nr:ACP phosphodiesterase [Parabacteroides sp. PFB2-10]MDH6311451.1 acyl carrier protein phosphodiesterase [Parabacteroides sp. PFB2-10]